MQRASPSHRDEIARPYYYSVLFTNPGIRVELTPTQHAAVFRFTFPPSVRGQIHFDTIDSASGTMSASLEESAISGHVDQDGYRSYFFARVDRALAEKSDPEGGGVNLSVAFDTGDDGVVHLRVATSFVSIEQARENLVAETDGTTFDEARASARSAWETLLGQVQIEGASDEQRTLFYSCLYRSFLYPSSMTETVGGQLKHRSPYSADVHNGSLYVNNGFWDTYRAVWPLLTLLIPTEAGEMLDGFVNAYKEGGWIPRWSGPGYLDMMVGSHSDIVLADAYLKGVRNFDLAAAYDSMLKNALVYSAQPALGRKGNARSIFRGYIPFEDAPESASWFLEDRINDFGIAKFAEALGDSTHAVYFLRRSRAYSNLFSEATGFFRGRFADGRFRTSDADFRPTEWGFEFTEGAAWHYIAAANHDPAGMARLYGGTDKFADRLQSMVSAPRDYLMGSYMDIIHEMKEAYDTNMGQYAHPNEPVHHVLYMFDYAGRPWLTQKYVRQVLQSGMYTAGLQDGRGYLGDEDNGQLSAWYVFSALGLYPAAPASGEYAIGSPLFPKAVLQLENGRTFTIEAHENGPENPYIQSASLDGASFGSSVIRHDTILAGGVLELQMGPEPSQWGMGHADDKRSAGTGARDCALVPGASLESAFDDDSKTSFVIKDQMATIDYKLSRSAGCRVDMYTITSSGGEPANDPRAWKLEGSVDGENWTTLDLRDNEEFRWRRQTRVFPANTEKPYPRMRLMITANHGGSSLEIAELELLESEAPSGPSSPRDAVTVPDAGATDGTMNDSESGVSTRADAVLDGGAGKADAPGPASDTSTRTHSNCATWTPRTRAAERRPWLAVLGCVGVWIARRKRWR